MIGWAILFAAPAAPVASPPVPQPEIVVSATRWKCQVRYAKRQLSDRQLGKLVEGWPADRPVRVVAPADADLRCLYRLTVQLSRGGTRVVEFVEPQADSADAESEPQHRDVPTPRR